VFQDGSDRWSTFTPRRRPDAERHGEQTPPKTSRTRPPSTTQTRRTSRSIGGTPRHGVTPPKISLTIGQDTEAEALGRYPTGRKTTAALSAHTDGKCTGCRPTPRSGASEDRVAPSTGANRMNTAEFRRLYPFPSKRFHALLNSLFKVLCNFPSRYLFAIGLVAVFSLR
jgi:hypothetical protein